MDAEGVLHHRLVDLPGCWLHAHPQFSCAIRAWQNIGRSPGCRLEISGPSTTTAFQIFEQILDQDPNGTC